MLDTTISKKRMQLKKLLTLISLGFGSGLSPIAPGTSGSIFALGLYFFFIHPFITNLVSLMLLVAFLVGSFLLGIYAYQKTVTGEEDPGSFVWDEFVGMWIACLPISIFVNFDFISKNNWWFVMAFVLFRAFDILKPRPIKYFDDKAGGFYVMMDDVAAGSIAGLILAVEILFTIN
jgi:phosphatidylglycerophosphatase A